MLDNSGTPIVFAEIFEKRAYERYGGVWAEVSPPGEGEVWIDAGAHIGLFTFRYARARTHAQSAVNTDSQL